MSGENPWQFELNGTIRSEHYNKFFGTTDELLKYKHAIVGGKLAVHLTDDEPNLKEIHKKFKKLSLSMKLIHKLLVCRNKVYSFIVPQKIQAKMRHKVKTYLHL